MTTQNYYFIDARVNDSQALISGLQSSDQWTMIDAKLDGLDQMATALAQVKNLAAIHIISHGAEFGKHSQLPSTAGGHRRELGPTGRPAVVRLRCGHWV